ncbi:MAG: hypothetical protein K0S40_3637 [Actinomycetospora sp.]|jgi:hypothetical protein|nr:hypothetical protein [Actinomycetospora sp.]
MIAHLPGADRTLETATEVAVPRPRSAEPRPAPQPKPQPVPAPDRTQDPVLVAAQLESSAALLTGIVRLALLVAVGIVVLVAVL